MQQEHVSLLLYEGGHVELVGVVEAGRVELFVDVCAQQVGRRGGGGRVRVRGGGEEGITCLYALQVGGGGGSGGWRGK